MNRGTVEVEVSEQVGVREQGRVYEEFKGAGAWYR